MHGPIKFFTIGLHSALLKYSLEETNPSYYFYTWRELTADGQYLRGESNFTSGLANGGIDMAAANYQADLFFNEIWQYGYSHFDMNYLNHFLPGYSGQGSPTPGTHHGTLSLSRSGWFRGIFVNNGAASSQGAQGNIRYKYQSWPYNQLPNVGNNTTVHDEISGFTWWPNASGSNGGVSPGLWNSQIIEWLWTPTF